MRLIFTQNLRTIQPQQKNKVSSFQLKHSEQNSSKCCTILAKCNLLHVYSH